MAPETALLGVYGNTPLDLNAGVANVSIPLADMSSGPLRQPVNLNYRTTGIKVNEMASWAGLGWTLNAGGVITRSVRGLPDVTRSSSGGLAYGWQRWQSRHTLNASDLHELQRQVAAGVIDTEPDVYNVSFGGQSAKIVYDATGRAHVEPFAAWQVTFDLVSGWTIITEDGAQYTFNQEETTNGIDNGPGDAVPTAWYLTYISSADGAHGINLAYRVDALHRVAAPGRKERVKLYGRGSEACRGREYSSPSCCPEDPVFSDEVPASVYDMQTVYLESIHSASTAVYFYSSANRADAGAAGDPRARCLDSLHVEDGRTTKRFVLTHGYFGPANPVIDPKFRRLKLASVREIGKPAYVFSYNEDPGMPPRDSFGQDHWGYANGVRNATLIPIVGQNLRQFFTGVGAQATRSSNFPAMQALSLARVTYPTGGHTSFTYEANAITTDRIPAFGEQLFDVSIGASVYVDADTALTRANMDDLDLAARSALYVQNDLGFGVVPYVDAVVLDLPYGAQVVEVVEDNRRPVGNTYAPQPYHETLLLDLNIPGTVSAADITPQTVNRNTRRCYSNPAVPAGSGSCTQTLSSLPPGKYLLVAAAHEIDALATLHLNLRLNPPPGGAPQPLRDRLVGGLRLRQTVDNSGQGDSIVKTYTYTQYDSLRQRTVSTGRLFYEPKYEEMTACGHMILSATDITYPALLDEGYHIGYERITTHLSGGGQTETSYLNGGGPATRGLVRREIVRRADGTLVNIKAREYQFLQSLSYVEGVTVKPYRLEHRGYSDPDRFVWSFTGKVDWTEIPSLFVTSWARLLSEREVNYATGAGVSSRQNRTSYTYPNPQGANLPLHTQAIATRTVGNMGEVLSTHRRFAADYSFTAPATDAPARGVRGLQQAHVLNALVEETRWVRSGNDSAVVSGQFTEYAGLWPRRQAHLRLSTPLPALQFHGSALQNGAFTFDPRYAPAISFDRYDLRGNLLQWHRMGGTPMGYLWGNKGTRLIAEAQHATALQLAYTSFEPGSSGRWVYDTTATAPLTPNARTGGWAYALAPAATVTSRALPAASYDVLFWSTAPLSVRVNGAATAAAAVADGPTGWHQYRVRVSVPTNGTVRLENVSGTQVVLDELRLHPTGAQMSTYTHLSSQGMTSQTDPSGRTITYEYDALGRLIRTHDERGHLLSQQEYHYILN